jgi:hypothetical protein
MMALKKPVDRTQDRAPTAAFFAVSLIGIVYILLAKSVGVQPVFVTIVPVLLMVGYAALIPLAPALRLRTDQTADNFYYMGFIFTLVSLGVSLMQYANGGGIDDIIRNFGIAIASTITGIILRIMFNLMRRDPAEIEHTSRLELADAARKVRREMDGVIYEMAHFRRTNQQMVQELYDEVRIQIASIGDTALSSIKDISTSAGDSLDGTMSQFSSPAMRQQLDRSSKSFEKVNERLEAATTSLTLASETFSKRLSDVQTPDKIVEVRMQPAVDALQKSIADAAEKTVAQSQEFFALRQDMALVVQSMQAVTAELQRVGQGLEKGVSQPKKPRRRGIKELIFRKKHTDAVPAEENA